MVLQKKCSYKFGYNSVLDMDEHEEMMLDVGILNLKKGDSFECSLELERAFMLMIGSIYYSWDGKKEKASRFSFLDEKPIVLQVSKGTTVKITAEEDSEVLIERCINEKEFESVFYSRKEVREEVFGNGVLDNTSRRIVRTVFDGELAPFSNMVMGEVINYPGKWSSYPPHDHPQPEVYYYRFFPKQGFGVSLLEDKATIVKDGDTSLIFPNNTHSQVAAPGYAMYYVWMISHLKNNKWLPTTRYYRKEHEWLNEKNVKIWPQKKFDK